MRLVWLGTLVLGACVSTGNRGASPDRAEDAQSALVARALPSVVLLLSHLPDGNIRYGAGLIVGDDGEVLTSLHVVDDATRVQAMLYRQGRVSYTPMDGGLTRYLYEYASELQEAHLEQADMVADLALVRISSSTKGMARLPLSTRGVQVGERVLALGHPQETVWSFTSGMVSALHQGAIQHDALISHGNSGGPLLDARGEVVGINTARVVGETRGVSFARPVAVAGWLLKQPVEGTLVDLSTPMSGAATCLRAQELSTGAFLECVDWDARYRVYLQAHAEVSRQLGDDAPALLPRAEWERQERAWLLAKLQPHPALPRACFINPDDPRQRSVVTQRDLAMRAQVRSDETRARETGMNIRLNDGKAVTALLRMGSRVEEVASVGTGRAWVRISGRNPDGTPYRYSELWARRDDGKWRVRSPPLDEDVHALPTGWPPPIQRPDVARNAMVVRLLDTCTSCADGGGGSDGSAHG